jgi:protein TonB
MMTHAIDRGRQTRGGLAASGAIHAALLLLLIIAMGRQVQELDLGHELTEIAYIEARYGEDVAAKVKLKAPPRRPEPFGMGVSTDSAQRPKQQAAEPEAPELAPRPEPRPALTRDIELPERPVTQERVVVRDAATPDIAPVTTEPKLLAEASRLQAADPRPVNRTIIDARKLAGALKTDVAEVAAPRASSASREDFVPQAGGALKAKQGQLAAADAVLPAAGSGGAAARIADGPTTVAGGGDLRSRARAEAYRAPVAGLERSDRSQSGTPGGTGVIDVDGPRGAGGREKGRRTVLDYGSGGGGRGGGLAGRRTRLVEPPTTAAIVASDPAEAGDAATEVVEAEVTAHGVGVTISGQIKGRKILHSVVPEYSDEARRNGWEGVVAVHFTVLADGRVKDNMYFEQTSVHRDLNQAAMAAVRQFRFAPLPVEQAAVEQWGVITIFFRLN